MARFEIKAKRTSRKAFLKEITDLAAGMRAMIEAEVSGFNPDPEVARERRAAAWDNFEYFARTYFPHYILSLIHIYAFQHACDEKKYCYRSAPPAAPNSEPCMVPSQRRGHQRMVPPGRS